MLQASLQRWLWVDASCKWALNWCDCRTWCAYRARSLCRKSLPFKRMSYSEVSYPKEFCTLLLWILKLHEFSPNFLEFLLVEVLVEIEHLISSSNKGNKYKIPPVFYWCNCILKKLQRALLLCKQADFNDINPPLLVSISRFCCCLFTAYLLLLQ